MRWRKEQSLVDVSPHSVAAEVYVHVYVIALLALRCGRFACSEDVVPADYAERDCHRTMGLQGEFHPRFPLTCTVDYRGFRLIGVHSVGLCLSVFRTNLC